MTPFLPALLLALSATWSGTFHGGASSLGALVGDLTLLLLAIAGAAVRDPLRLRRGAQLLVWALAAVVVGSALVSPVPRAGLETIVMLPVAALLPAATAQLWPDAARLRSGCRSITLVAAVVSAWGLVDAAARGTWRAAAPLGHHGALGLWLLVAIPFAWVAARGPGRWRVAGVATVAASIACALLTRSLAVEGLLAVEIGLLAAAWRRAGTSSRPRSATASPPTIAPAGSRSSRRAACWVFLLVVALVATLELPRLIAIARRADPSVLARIAYLEAGVAGVRARPGLGWGPGSVGWTVSEHLRPRPGANPPGEIVSYLHFLPLDLAYQLGVGGALLALGVMVAFLVARWRERRHAPDAFAFTASFIALVAGLAGLCAIGFPPLGAPVIVVLVAAGAAIASSLGTARDGVRSLVSRKSRVPVVAGYVLLALFVLTPVRRAHRAYDEARGATSPLEPLERAARADPAFPLYRARHAWAVAASSADLSTPPDEALRAAEDAHAVGPLWLAAGLLGDDAGAPWADGALVRACDLDPLGALAPFRLAMRATDGPAAGLAGARALLAEPRLAAAVEWTARDWLFERAREEVVAWPGVDPGYRRRLADALATLPAPSGHVQNLSLELDAAAGTSFSLFVFRRLPWRSSLGTIELDAERLRGIRLGPATMRADTERWAFPRNGCGRAEPPK